VRGRVFGAAGNRASSIIKKVRRHACAKLQSRYELLCLPEKSCFCRQKTTCWSPNRMAHVTHAKRTGRGAKEKKGIKMATKEKERMPARLGSAAEVCEERRADCEALLDHLGELLRAHQPDNDWSAAGSLGHLRKLLAEAVSFYGGLDTEDIEAVLAEIRG